jgi:hypothetical protein
LNDNAGEERPEAPSKAALTANRRKPQGMSAFELAEREISLRRMAIQEAGLMGREQHDRCSAILP